MQAEPSVCFTPVSCLLGPFLYSWVTFQEDCRILRVLFLFRSCFKYLIYSPCCGRVSLPPGPPSELTLLLSYCRTNHLLWTSVTICNNSTHPFIHSCIYPPDLYMFLGENLGPQRSAPVLPSLSNE